MKPLLKTEEHTAESLPHEPVITYNSCDHDFRFSHIEYPSQGTYSAIPPNKEVVVCRKCGEIRKFIQQ